MTSGAISNSWTYDTRGRMLSETVADLGTAYTTQWTYNAADMPITMKYPDNETVTYNYNPRMMLDSVIGTDTYVSATGYDSAGRMTSRALGNGLTQAFDYYNWDEKVNNVGQGGRLQNLTTGSLQNINYTYDPVGNISNITNTLASETNIYGYDALDRLTSWNLNGTIEDYSYDPATGNLSSKAGIGFTYNAQVTCSKGNRTIPHAVSARSAHTYSYDCNGNQTERVVSGFVGSDTFTFIYDAENRLVEVKKNSVTIAQFTFDGDGRRVKSVVNGETILFVGGHYEIKNPGSGQTVTKYYFAGSSRIAMRKYTIPQSMSVEYMLGDHLGSTSITADSTGAKVSEMRYKPWGEVRYSWTAGLSTTPAYKLNSYTFTGQYSYMDDPSTAGVTEGFGLLFYNARFYDPYLGRFAQADTIVPGGVQGLDRYAYANNNPIMYIDPSGHGSVCTGANADPECNGGQDNWDGTQAQLHGQTTLGTPDIIDTNVLNEYATSLYAMYRKMYADTNGWWWDVYGSGGFTIWEFMAIQWGLERDEYPDLNSYSTALANRAAVWCTTYRACDMSKPEWNLNFLGSYTHRPGSEVQNCIYDVNCGISSVVRKPHFGNSMSIVSAIHSRNSLQEDPVGPNDLYTVGNVSMASDIYLQMIKKNMVFDSWGTGDTFIVLRKCETDFFDYVRANGGTKAITTGNYHRYCG